MTHTDTPTKGATTNELDPYLSPTEVAAELGLSRNWATTLLRRGVIPGAVDLSSNGERATLRIRRSALRAWTASRAL